MSRSTKAVRFRHDDALTRVSRSEFERLIATHYRGEGYAVEHAGSATRQRDTEGGSALKLIRGDETVVVQCKHWVAQQVPHHDVHEVVTAMHAAVASHAIVITSGEFSRAAVDAAERMPQVTLIDGVGVRAMLGKVSEPALPLLSDSEPLPWETDEPRPPSRAPVFAAVSAVIVMGVMLCMMYGVYIHEIQRAQMQAMQSTSRHDATAVVREGVADWQPKRTGPVKIVEMPQEKP